MIRRNIIIIFKTVSLIPRKIEFFFIGLSNYNITEYYKEFLYMSLIIIIINIYVLCEHLKTIFESAPITI